MSRRSTKMRSGATGSLAVSETLWPRSGTRVQHAALLQTLLQRRIAQRGHTTKPGDSLSNFL